MFDVIVAGAGFAGAVAARILAENNKKVLVVERRRQIAGNCYDETNSAGITIHKYGPHIFHTNNKAAWDFINRFGEFNGFQHRVRSYAGGQFYPFPINRDTVNQVFGLKLSNNDIPAFLKEQSSFAGGEINNYRDAVVSQVGQTLYDLFFSGYTRKQWGREPEELSASLASRIPVRDNGDDRYFTDRYQGLPRHGYTRLVENILNHDNISLMLGADYFEVSKLFKPELTVFTGELDRYFDYSDGRLDYRSVRITFETLPVESYQPAAVVNYPNDYDFTRITEFKKMTLEESPSTTICKEYPSADGEKLYIVPDEKNSNCRARYIKKAQSLEAAGTHLFIGRLAEYKYYNMDAVIISAMEKTQNWLQTHRVKAAGIEE